MTLELITYQLKEETGKYERITKGGKMKMILAEMMIWVINLILNTFYTVEEIEQMEGELHVD